MLLCRGKPHPSPQVGLVENGARIDAIGANDLARGRAWLRRPADGKPRGRLGDPQNSFGPQPFQQQMLRCEEVLR
jgi:hypothetical protein